MCAFWSSAALLLMAFLGQTLASLNSISFDQSQPMPRVASLDVKCGRSGMTVAIQFDLPFNGVIFSKGHYFDPKCVYVTEATTQQRQFVFQVPIYGCGTSGRLEEASPDEDMYFENTIIIQNDPLIQEVWDQARHLRCVWQHTISRSVHSKPITVYDPQMVNVEFDSRAVNTLMTVQKGRSPLSSPAKGYVYAGDEASSVVIYVQDKSRMDANVMSCDMISSGHTIPLTDENGCVLQRDFMTPFVKSRDSNGVQADLMLYSYLKGFHLDEKSDFKIRCRMEVCSGSCKPACNQGNHGFRIRRNKREAPQNAIQPHEDKLPDGVFIEAQENGISFLKTCFLNNAIAATVIVLLVLVCVLTLVSCCLAARLKRLYSREATDKTVC